MTRKVTPKKSLKKPTKPTKRVLAKVPAKKSPAPTRKLYDEREEDQDNDLVKPEPRPVPMVHKPVIDTGRARIDIDSIARKAMQLKQQHVKKVDGFGKPVPKERKVAEYLIRFEDGIVLHAEGHHADVLVRFTDECQSICMGQGLAMYNGPGMTKYTPEEWAER